MGNQITVELTAKDAEMVAAWQRAKNNVGEFEDAIKKSDHAGKEAFETIGSGISNTMTNLGTMVLGFAGFEKVLHGISDGFEKFQTEGIKAAERGHEFSERLMRDLARTGDLAQQPKIARALGSIEGVRKSEAETVFKGIRAGAPELDLDRALELENAAARPALLLDESEREAYGRTVAKMARLAPGRSGTDIANLAKSVRERAGDKADELLGPAFELTAGVMTGQLGMRPEDALGLQLAGLKAGIGPKAMQSIIAKAVEPMEAELEKQPHTPRENTVREFARKGPAERLDLLLHDKHTADAVLGGGLGVKHGQLDRALAAKEAAGLAADIQNDLTAREAATARQNNEHFFRNRGLDMALEKRGLDRATLRNYAGWEAQSKESDLRLGAYGGFGAAFGGVGNFFDYLGDKFAPDWAFEQEQRRAKQGCPPKSTGIGWFDRFGGAVEGAANFLRGDSATAPPPPAVREEHTSILRELSNHLAEQTRLLQQLVAKPQSLAVNVQPAAGRGPRIDATRPAEPSLSTALSG